MSIDFSVQREMLLVPISGKSDPCPRCGVKRARSAKLKMPRGAACGSNDTIQICPTKPGSNSALNERWNLGSDSKPTRPGVNNSSN